MSKIIVLDDEVAFCDSTAQMLRLQQHDVKACYKIADCKRELAAGSVDIVLMDVFLPDGSGIDTLQHIRDKYPDIPVIMMTGMEDVRKAIECIRLGAEEYFLKPIRTDELLFAIEKAQERRRRQFELSMYRDTGKSPIIGTSAAMRRVREMIERAAANVDTTVLITGETGTGKELVARHVHTLSSRGRETFIPVNCSSIPENLIESEFFGHEKGAFTGADRQQKGVFERAHGGTVFLDEIGDMDVRLQTSLLRFMESRCVRRIGGGEIDVDVRIVCATNMDLPGAVESGRFRRDLYYRVNVLNIHLPPLRERVEDIPPLVGHFIAQFANRLPLPTVTADGLARLTAYDWPGNIRELRNIVERELILSRTAELDFCGAFDGRIRSALPREEADGRLRVLVDYDNPVSLDGIERQVIVGALEHCSGNVSRAAEVLQLGRSSLRSKIRRLKISHKSE